MTLMQDMKICGPEGRDCIEKNSAQTYNCSESCEGVYADIYWKNETYNYWMRKEGKDKEKMKKLLFEYQQLKRGNVKHFRFRSDFSQNTMGWGHWDGIDMFGNYV